MIIGNAGQGGGKRETTAAVSVERVSKEFGAGTYAFRALDDVSVEIASNEFFTLLGPSGCGKTTLLRLIAGFETPTGGDIRLAGERIVDLPPFRRPINTVFQSYALFPHMSVRQNIAFGLEMQRRPKAEIARTVDEMLALVKMEAMADRTINQISGGQQQRVALARALAPKPLVLLLDEPLSALDLQLRKDMQVELKRLQTETGITFIFVTHDQEEALTMSDRIAVMKDGRILQLGSPVEIYERPQTRFVASFIGEINLLDAKLSIGRNGKPSAKLGQGQSIALSDTDGRADGESLLLAIRPESLSVGPATKAGAKGKITNIVYRGTDTIYHLLLDGQELRVRHQNRSRTSKVFGIGDIVGWSVEPESVAILEDG